MELTQRRLQDKQQKLAWDDQLRGGRDSYPLVLPRGIQTAVAGRGEHRRLGAGRCRQR